MILLLIFIIFIGCTSGISPINNKNLLGEESARAGMSFTFDSKTYYSGTATVSHKPVHNISFWLPNDTIKFMLTTCAREEFFAYPKDKAWFLYQYKPVANLEDSGSCFLTATAITNKGATHKALIDFRGSESLESVVSCNGKTTEEKGVFLCQSREGLMQMLQFKNPVAFTHSHTCPEPIEGILKNGFEIKLGKNFCIYKFIDNNKNVFRLTTFGYQIINEIILDGG